MGTENTTYQYSARKGGRPSAKQVQQLTNVIARRLPFFYRIAFNRLGNIADAEDAVQDAFLSAFTHLHQFRGQAKLSTWLTMIVINSARMKIRQRPRHLHVPLAGDDREQDNLPLSEMLPDGRPTPEEVYQRCELEERIVELSRQLSPGLRKTFQMRDVYGLTVRETAQVLGLPEGTVKSHVVRARAKLLKLMRKSLGSSAMRSEVESFHKQSR